MPLISRLGAASSRGFGQFTQQVSGKYIEDYFSTYLYTGNGGSSQTISNGIGLADTAAWSTQISSTNVYNATTDSSGNYYVAFQTLDSPSKAVVAKYNSLGVVQWQRALSAANNTYGYNVYVDSSQNVYFIGTIYNGPGNGFSCFIAKYNSSGTLQWQRTLSSGTNTIQAYSVVADSSGNVYATGYSSISVNQNLWLVKWNSSGTLQWQRRFFGVNSVSSQTGLGFGLALDSSSNIYAVGRFYDTSDYAYGVILKWDTNGNIQWKNKFYQSLTGVAAGYGITIDSSDNIYVVGTAYSSAGSVSYGLLAKYDTSGTLQAATRLDSGTFALNVATTDSSGNIYVYGNRSITSVVAKYNSSLTLQWQSEYFVNSAAQSAGIGQDGSGNLYIAGTNSIGNIGYVAKLKTDGSASSGYAYYNLAPGSLTSASATLTSNTATQTETSGILTEAAGSLTDAAGSITTTTYSQAAVTGAEGLVWIKGRDSASQSTGHILTDTVRGRGSYLQTQNTTQAVTSPAGYDFQSFNANGFTVGSANNFSLVNSSVNYATWTWRTTPKFFDVVTYTGNGVAGTTVTHNLGSVPGMIIVKCVSSPTPGGDAGNWTVYHRAMAASSPESYFMTLNTTNAYQAGANRWNNTAPTSTNFTVGNSVQVNANGETYVAYLFAHNAGGFGDDGSQNVVSCGSFTTDGSGNATINLGYEPQFVLFKRTDSTQNWAIFDNMRGWSYNNIGNVLSPNVVNAEVNYGSCYPSPTGIILTGGLGTGTFIYMAIRRGPMRVPTDATKVFNPYYRSGSASTTIQIPSTALTYAPDAYLGFVAYSGSSSFPHYFVNRLADQYSLQSESSAAEQFGPGNPLATISGFQGKVQIGAAGLVNSSGTEIVDMYLQRAPKFFDITIANGTSTGVSNWPHNLGVAPEFILRKSRTNAYAWNIWHKDVAGSAAFSTAAWSTGSGLWLYDGVSTNMTSSYYSTGASAQINSSGDSFVTYLFASCPGVSKVGSYTGTGTTQQINCGFTAGARFLLIKRVDSTGGWYFWNSASGISTGNDPYMLINSDSQIAPSTDYIDPYSAGFEISSTAPAALNANGGTYVFLAIA